MATVDQGISKYKEGKFDEALVVFEKVLVSIPGDVECLTYRARTYSRLGRFEDSLVDFDTALRGNNFNCDLISDRAVVLHLMGRNEEALAELDRAQNLEPKNPYRYSSRAFLKDRMGDLNGALADYEIAIELDPEDAISLNNKGIVEEKLGYRAKSKKSFAKADELIGYKPMKPSMESSEKDSHTRTKVTPAYINENKRDTKLSFSYVVDTCKELLSNGEARNEFWNFVRNGFKRS
ncbi:TPR repeat protein [Lunatimonas lonarensis]|uniref:TPR repeat protein n=1 Tax=Lunatimonas lonarensis TaxID=1232681 RepID=R7ZRE7_9BACT|nr:tetratricopeptide repeat protein [Lunatimonas lonarensis]EON76726.1 TPR repeat protein [Lunatimonas lonarensis]